MSKELIYKESALDILDDFQSDIENSVPNAYAMARQRMSGLYPRNLDWIPCSERLPEKDGKYLCTVNRELRVVRTMFYRPSAWDAENKCKWKTSDDFYAYDWFVLAWMPLPEPWKGADDAL